jgi:phosphatidylinositol kinase/protein kinase (PI-3  family)
MEVSGIEGNFRFTCKNVMRVLREHRPSVMAMLEAFVYDPLINWRLLESTAVKAMPASIVEGSLIVGAAAGVAADAPSGLQSEDLSMQRPTHHRSVFETFFSQIALCSFF